jgi:hypothetical protein
MATGGSTPIPSRPGSTSRTSPRCPAAASFSAVVQRCPAAGTHWRSSAQMTQTPGGDAASGYWLAQVAQIQTGTMVPP